MALPASGPISSSQVATEFSVSQTSISLSNLGTKLSSAITAGQPVELASDFYGQSAGVNVTSFTTSELQSSGNSACSIEEPENTLYHDGGAGEPTVGDTVYTDDPGTTTLGTGFILFLVEGETRTAFQINSDGEIIGATTCR